MKHSLKPLTLEDSARVLGWRNQPDVARYMYTSHVITPAEHDAWLARTLADPTRAYWIILQDGVPLGVANFYDISTTHRRASWAFYLAEAAGRGQGTGAWVEYTMLNHAFETLGLEKLCCEVLDFNVKVAAMHRSFGFLEEGRLRAHIFRDGYAYDVLVMGLLRRQWQAARPAVEQRLAARGLLASRPEGHTP